VVVEVYYREGGSWRSVVDTKYDRLKGGWGALWCGSVEMYKEGVGRFF
jgi:hypothetical protein